jgi:hypothetical protein
MTHTIMQGMPDDESTQLHAQQPSSIHAWHLFVAYVNIRLRQCDDCALTTRALPLCPVQPPLPPGIEQHKDGEGLEDDQEAGGAAAAPTRGRGRPRSSKAAAAAAATADGATTPHSTVRRGRGSAAAAAGGADSGVESDAAASTGKARAARGRKAAATPGV